MAYLGSIRVSIPVNLLLCGGEERAGTLIRCSQRHLLVEGTGAVEPETEIVLYTQCGERFAGLAKPIGENSATIRLRASKSCQEKLRRLMNRDEDRFEASASLSHTSLQQGWKKRAPRIASDGKTLKATRPCGAEISCRIVDMSLSGMGIATDAFIPVGEVIKVGKASARVVRKSEHGYGLALVDAAEFAGASLESERHALSPERDQPQTSIFRPIRGHAATGL